MDIRFLGKNLTVTEGMKEHIEEKLVKLEKYAPRLVESHVVLRKEKYFYKAEITLLAKNLRVYGDGENKDNIFMAIDEAYVRIEKQLKKFREKLKTHHVKGEVKVAESLERLKVGDAEDGPAGFEADTKRPKIVRSNDFLAKPMLPEEASLQLKLSKENFLVFLNPKNERVNVIYKMKNGNHGLIEPGY